MVQGTGRAKEDGGIYADNFGGLNTTSSALNLPLSDAPYVLNVDIDVSGKVKKRKGTRTFWTEPSSERISVHEIQSNLGYSFLLSKRDNDLRVFEVDNDTAVLLWSRSQVFRTVIEFVDFVNIPGDVVKCLMLNSTHAPVQLQIHEQKIITTAVQTTLNVKPEFASLGISVIYKNNVKVSGFTLVGSSLTLPSPTAVADAFDIITFSWQWLAESYYFFGDNFYRTITRAGATLSDQNVEIPKTINSDIPNLKFPDEYGIYAFVNNKFDNQYIYRQNGKPESAFEYYFGDGSTYIYNADNSVTPSPFFVTFGRESSIVKGTLRDINVIGNVINIKDHQLQSFDILQFYAEDLLIPPLLPNIPYYVSRIDENRFTLFTDDTLTIQVLFTTRPRFNFSDADIDTSTNRIEFAHPFAVGSIVPVRFSNADYLLPGGTTPDTIYYAYALNANNLEIYFNKNATRRVDLIPRPERIAFAVNVAPNPQNIITINSHLLFARDRVRLYPYTGSTLPGGVVDGDSDFYYVDIINPSAIQLFRNVALTNLVVLTNAGIGEFRVVVDGGIMTLTQEGGEQTFEKIRYNKVDFVRLRDLAFNGKTGITVSNLHVTVNGIVVPANVSPNVGLLPKYAYQLFSQTGYNPVSSAGVTGFRLGFTGSTEIGLPQNAIVKITNTRPQWVGSAALNVPYANNNGSWVSLYGISKFCNYLTGQFPNVGSIFQSRLVIAGLQSSAQQVLFSSKSALGNPDDFYYYFQITDDNVTPDVDPFDVIIPELANYAIQCIKEWQRALYIFTNNSVFRTFSQDGNVTINSRVVGKVAEKGALNSRCVALTESSILFLSDTGVFDLKPLLEQEYRASEISIKIRGQFDVLRQNKYQKLPWVSFDSANLRLFIGVPRDSDVNQSSRLMVFDTIQNAWTEYSSFYYFKSYYGITYRDKSLGRQYMIAHKLPCVTAFTRFGYEKYLDFVQTSNTLSGVVSVAPVFWSAPTHTGILEYKPDIQMIPLRNVNDIRVFVGSSLTTPDAMVELLHRTQWIKTNDGFIKLRQNPGNNFIAVTPNVPGSFYGGLLEIDNIPQTLTDLSFGKIFFGTPCLCFFQGQAYGGIGNYTDKCNFITIPNAKAIVGYAYPAIYQSPIFTAERLANFKRIGHLHVMFENTVHKFNSSDVNQVTQQLVQLVNKLKYEAAVSVGITYQTDTYSETSEDVFKRPNVQKVDRWVVFKEPLKGVGYSYQYTAFSLNKDSWCMSGYQITGQMQGERHISGDR